MSAELFTELLNAAKSGAKVAIHSERVTPGGIFIALAGTRADGAKYIERALNNGAAWIVTDSEAFYSASGKIVRVVDVRKALGELAALECGTLAGNPKVIGITGTNGKTTIAYILEHVFSAAAKVGMIGTVEYRWPGHHEVASLTTPDCLSIHCMLKKMRDSGVEVAIMEASSHALDQSRLAGINFAAAVLTNVTQDHLDYHGDMENYFQAKRRLFKDLPAENKICVLNADDPFGLRLLKEIPDAVGYSITDSGLEKEKYDPERIFKGIIVANGKQGFELKVKFAEQDFLLKSRLIGRHNMYNLLAALAVSILSGLSAPDVLEKLESFSGVPGRLERIENSKGKYVFVDYAHTPDALTNVLGALREVGFKRIVTVFGCGGDRDRTKRPLMGQAVWKGSDVCVLTSDNPRNEDPLSIMDDVRIGLRDLNGSNGNKIVLSDPDRRKAIALALLETQPGDALLVAGKGHEDYQQIGNKKIPFSDALILRELFQCA